VQIAVGSDGLWRRFAPAFDLDRPDWSTNPKRVADRDALILNGRYFNLEYGSYAPGAPDVFIDDEQFKKLWFDARRFYLVTYAERLPDFEKLVGREQLTIVAASGGKLLLTNHSADGPGL